jgi:hypothetical protein
VVKIPMIRASFMLGMLCLALGSHASLAAGSSTRMPGLVFLSAIRTTGVLGIPCRMEWG